MGYLSSVNFLKWCFCLFYFHHLLQCFLCIFFPLFYCRICFISQRLVIHFSGYIFAKLSFSCKHSILHVLRDFPQYHFMLLSMVSNFLHTYKCFLPFYFAYILFYMYSITWFATSSYQWCLLIIFRLISRFVFLL